MPFLYEFIIDNQKVDVEMGFSTSRKWEEALDEAKLVIPFSYLNDTPYKMFSMLNIEIIEIASYANRTPIATKTYEFIIYSDRPESVGSYGYYRHNVSAIEYTAKLDAYFIRQLAKSRSIIRNVQAPFITNDEINYPNVAKINFVINANLQGIKVNENIRANKEVVFPQVYQPYIATGTNPYYRRGNAVIKTNATLISGTTPHTLSSGEAKWIFPKGKWYIEYGYNGEIGDAVGALSGFNMVYTFYVEAVDENEVTMYDVVNEIRNCISKFGGIEDTIYYNSTRVFDIDPEYEDLLKSTQAPQIYMSNASARQMLIYTLAFVNALPRLYRGEKLDLLSLEQYNLNTGSFAIQDVVAFGGQQNTNQIGTRNYQSISQALANDLDDPSITFPSNTGFQQVRSLDIQLTADNFGIKLPERSPLYMPNKLFNLVPRIRTKTYKNIIETIYIDDFTNYEIDITPRWINGEEWKLKLITEDFPNIENIFMWEERLGLRENKVDNIYWNTGDTEIKLATVFGSLFKDNLIRNVVLEGIYEHFVVNPPLPYFDIDGSMLSTYGLEITLPSTSDYQDWRFRVEYITDERLVIKQDKEDLSQINFYSEMRQNQEEALVNIVRQSKKGYGDLQRTGNVTFSFPKKHTSLSEFYQVGQKDVNDYTITQIDTQWFNDYAMAVYHVTRYHNRIQQSTFVNQKYRPFDNFAKSVLDRHEYYGDYLIAIPPDDVDSNIQEQSTKIYSKDRTVRKIVEILLGDVVPVSNRKASVALVRTDGMMEIYPESKSTVRFISLPVTARGIKGGFAFTFGFESNQVAGDGLVSKTKSGVTTYYNSAVRYTDSKGRFTRFGFAIMRDMVFDSNDIPLYPLVENNAVSFLTYFHANAYFWCGVYVPNATYAHPLIWNKDPMTNAGLTYGLNVISYYVGLYIFGIKFFTDNFMVKEHDTWNGAKLYLYINGTTYDMFDDLYVKSGYTTVVTLQDGVNIEYDSLENAVNFIGITMTYYTSWAIGVENTESGAIELLLACNENLSGIKFVNQHVRPGVSEIGHVGFTSNTYILTETILHETIVGNMNIIGETKRYVTQGNELEYGDDYWQDVVDTETINHSTTIGNMNTLQGSRVITETETFEYGDDYWQSIIDLETVFHETTIGNTNTAIGTHAIDETTTTSTLRWASTSDTSFDFDLVYATEGTSCATFITILTWLRENYSANDYGLGTIVRVTRNSGYICSPIYYYYKVE